MDEMTIFLEEACHCYPSAEQIDSWASRLLLRTPDVPVTGELMDDMPIRLPFGNVSVKVRRGWHRAYIAVGSNLGNRKTHILSGIQALKVHPLIKLKKVSKMIVTEPYGGVEQEDFLNGALEIETLLEPEELLEVLHQVEDAEGRKRTLRWGPRTLDLDILFYDRICYESENLVIPHVDLENRVFVLKPMSEIAPYFRHPINHKTMMGLLKELEQKNEEDGDRPSSVEISLES